MESPLFASRYRLETCLGEGSLGQVWRALDTTSLEAVALKVLGRRRQEKSALQLKQEFRQLTRLRHPNCCAVHDYGVLPDGRAYFAMELVEGTDLDELTPMPAAAFGPLFVQLLAALSYLHARGLVHRDLKPENIRVRPDGVLKLMDFGLVDYAGRAGGTLAGSAGYMAPEVIRGGAVDQRTDLYAAGCLAYEALTGRAPFAGGGVADTFRAHLHDAPIPPASRAPGVPDAWDALVMRLLAKDPLDRPQSAQAVLAELGASVPAGYGGRLLAAPLVGREATVAVLESALDRLREGTGGVIRLVGPAGAGKSRLGEELRVSALLRELPCAVADAGRHGAAPYGPVAAALRALLPALRRDAAQALAHHGPALARLGVETGLAPAPALDPEPEKARLQAAVTAALTALARARGLVLLLEDAHLADPLTHDLLAYLLRNARGVPLLVVATHADAAEAPGWAEGAAPIAVAPLGPEDTRRMAAAMLGTKSLAPGFVRHVRRFSAGNPFLVEQLLEHLAESGALAASEVGWATDAFSGLALPSDFETLMAARLGALPPSARRLAEAAALLGPMSELETLQEATGLAEEALFEAVAALRQARLTDAAEDALSFSHARIREAILAGIPAGTRAARHGEAARALARRVGEAAAEGAPLVLVTALADLFAMSDTPDRMVPYALAAGRRMGQLFAHVEARRLLESGLARVRAGSGDAGTAFAFLAALGDVRRVAGDLRGAVAAYEEALAQDVSADPATCGWLHASLAKARQGVDDLDGALEGADRATALCQAAGDRVGEARARLTGARVRFFKGELALARHEVITALELARSEGDPVRQAEALALAGYLDVAAGGAALDAGVRALNAAIALSEGLDDRVGLTMNWLLMGDAQTMLGDLAGARGSFETARELARENGNRSEAGIAAINLAVVALEAGRFGAARAHAEAAEGDARAIGNRFQAGLAGALAAAADARTGPAAEVPARLTAAVAEAVALENRYMEGLLLPLQAETLLFLGEVRAATAATEAFAAHLEAAGGTDAEGRLARLQAELLAVRGELGLATATAERERAASRASRSRTRAARAAALTARIDGLAARHATAETHAGEALALAREAGMVDLEAEMEGLLAEAALRRDSTATARGRYAAMARRARQSGSLPRQAQALLGLAAADGRAPDEGLALLARYLAPLPAPARQAFVALPGRERLQASIC